MTTRVLAIVALAIVLVGIPLLAESLLSGTWSMDVTLNPTGSLFGSLDSVLEMGYSFGNLAASSISYFILGGYICQGFGLTGTIGAFDVQGNALFGPSSAQYLYTQMIAEVSVGVADLGLYVAQLTDAVLGGPACGMVVRMAGSSGGVQIESITEFGAHIEGITIVHAATGLSMDYTTNPLEPAQCFTAEKLTVSGLSFGCAENISARLIMSCANGFESLTFSVLGVETLVPWLAVDVELTFETQTKSLALTPKVMLEDLGCVELYAELDDSAGTIGELSIHGLGISAEFNGVSFMSLSVFDAGYVLTADQHGSTVMTIADALAQGVDFYPSYWELFSIETAGDGCCGETYSFLTNTYFDTNSSSLFDWGMSYVEAVIPVGPGFSLKGSIKLTPAGLETLVLGLTVSW